MKVNRDFSAKVREQIQERADDRCEVCRLRPIGAFHHRLRRSQSGLGTLENGLGVCDGFDGSCHRWIHDNPDEAFEMGWLLHPEPVNTGLKVR